MKKKILVIDDALDTLQLVRAMLEEAGYEVTTAVNGIEGLERAREDRPAMIIADVLMPEMDGYAFFKELKKDRALTRVPVLILTARGKMEDSFRAVGANGFLAKPINAEQLLGEVEREIGKPISTVPVTSSGRSSGEAEKPGEAAPVVVPEAAQEGYKSPSGKRALILGFEDSVMTEMRQQIEELRCVAIICHDEKELVRQLESSAVEVIFLEIKPDSPLPLEAILEDLQAILKVKPQGLFQDEAITDIIIYKVHHAVSGTASVGAEVADIDGILARCTEIGFSKYIGLYSPLTFKMKIKDYLP